LLQWLLEQPLTLSEIKQRMKTHPDIEADVSSDSIWGYMNTLKALGCLISRPGPSNQHQFQLLRSSFGLPLSEADETLLIQVRRLAEQHLPYVTMLHFDRFLTRVFWHKIPQLPRELREAGVETSKSLEALRRSVQKKQPARTLNHDNYASIIALLEEFLGVHTPQHTFGNNVSAWLSLLYQSPAHGHKTILFFPRQLIYRNGTLQLWGYSYTHRQWVCLRVDRIRLAQILHHPSLPPSKNTCPENQFTLPPPPPPVILEIRQWPLPQPWGLGETLCEDKAPPNTVGYRVCVEAVNWFDLKQMLLAHGEPVHIVSPATLAEDFAQTLRNMQAHYAPVKPGNNRPSLSLTSEPDASPYRKYK
jgi:hypothetical protein